MKEFLKDIIDIDTKMSFKKWLKILAITFFLTCAGTALGVYINIYWS